MLILKCDVVIFFMMIGNLNYFHPAKIKEKLSLA